MSPGISLSINLREERRTPRMSVLVALTQARGNSIPLRFGEAGVERGAFTEHWRIDRKALPGGVSLAGCVLLAMQPESSPDEDPDAAVARALGVPLAFAVGMAAGWDMDAMSTFWIGGDENRKHYVAGFSVGAECRFLAVLTCPRCNAVRFRGDGDACPGCDS
jgi:hypothetical protein